MLAPGDAEARQMMDSFRSEAEAVAFWAGGTQDAGERALVYPGADADLRAARHYPGAGPADGPGSGSARSKGTLLYIHGGGWTGGSIALNHRACRRLAAQSGWDVVSVSYRLAPDHPFPAGLSDCRAALDWLGREGAALGLNTRRIACGGASAGGNLALALALGPRPVPLAALVLFYPVTGADFDSASYRRHADGFGLTRARMQAHFAHYDPEGRRGSDPEVTPLCASVAQLRAAELPPTLMIAAECDVLADDSRRMAARLQEAGIDTTLHTEPGVTHGFINRGRLIPAADACLQRAAHFLKDLP